LATLEDAARFIGQMKPWRATAQMEFALRVEGWM
jgi:hypothetical protein